VRFLHSSAVLIHVPKSFGPSGHLIVRPGGDLFLPKGTNCKTIIPNVSPERSTVAERCEGLDAVLYRLISSVLVMNNYAHMPTNFFVLATYNSAHMPTNLASPDAQHWDLFFHRFAQESYSNTSSAQVTAPGLSDGICPKAL